LGNSFDFEDGDFTDSSLRRSDAARFSNLIVRRKRPDSAPHFRYLAFEGHAAIAEYLRRMD
jgi:hypothetical protein